MLQTYARELACGAPQDEASCAPGVRWKFWVGVVALVLGIAFMIGGTSVYFYLDHRLRNEIEDFVIVDSPDSYGYDDWVFNGNPDSPDLIASYSLWNLTNAQELQAGLSTKPVYQAIGPFNYRKLQKKIAIQFLNGGEQVSFAEWTYYVFDPKNSVGDPDSMLITNVNQAYVGVMAQTKGEQGLVVSLIGPTLGQIMGLFTTIFVDIVAIQGAALNLPEIKIATVAGIQAAYNVSSSEAEAIFYNTWANGTTANPQIWGTIGTLCNNATTCTPSGITADTAAKLWNGNGTYPNFVNPDPSNVFLWYQASAAPTSPAAQSLQARFSLSATQLNLIFNWLASLKTRVILPGLINQFQVANAQQLGYLQWGTAVLTNYISVKDLVPSNPFGLAGIPEIAVWSNFTLTFNVSQSLKLLTGTYALTEVNNVILFLTLLGSGNQQAIQTNWGLSFTDAVKLKGYFDYLSSTFVNQALQAVFRTGNATYPYLGSGGLFTTRTATQWLWGAQDPLLKLLQLPTTTVALQVNQTSEAEAYQQANSSVLWTGKGDVDRAFAYINWQGLTQLPAGGPWAEAIPVTGGYGTQFPPFLSHDDAVIVWIPEVLRAVRLRYTEEVTKFGITLFRFKLDPAAFDPNPIFYQSANTTGFANMTGSYGGAPIYISKPRMLDCAAEWRQKVDGVIPSGADDTFIDIEPLTGYVMDVDKQLEVNVFLQSSTGLNLFNSKVPINVIYPIFWNNLNSEITSSLANDFKDKVYSVVDARFITFYVTLSVGGFMILASVALFAFLLWWNWRYNKVSYVGIPDKPVF